MHKTIMVTGACGFIGTHLCLALIENDFRIIAADNLSNSNKDSLEKLSLLHKEARTNIHYEEVDIASYEEMSRIFAANKIEAVIHLAALKAVGESTERPLSYHKNNIGGLLNLLRVMNEHRCYKMVFSSSATVYGYPQYLPMDEKHPLAGTNPYGNSKIISEYILEDIANIDYHNPKKFNIISLRYFNPAGAHPSGLIGEDFRAKPANLFPAICHSLYAKEQSNIDDFQLQIFGDDYDTADGTCVRDIIHIQDLVAGHIAALGKLDDHRGFSAVNLGTGKGHSVLEIIKSFESELGQKLDYKIAAARPGDVPVSYACADYAKEFLGWKTQQDLPAICRDAINFYKKSISKT